MRFVAIAFSLLMVLCASGAGERPNIILVLTDDQGYGDLGVHGNEAIDTPYLDAFASQALGMERFYVNPLCSPTRASIMTGRYHLRTGILHTSRGAAKMFGDEYTIAEAFRNGGYRTGIFGKWHLGDNYPMRPQDQGFEETLIHKSGGIGQTPDTDADYFNPVLWLNGERIKAKGYCTDLFFEGALSFLKEDTEKPFFLYIPLNVPHTPLVVADQYSRAFEEEGLSEATAKIYGMLKNLDDNFGAMMAQLEAQGIGDDTIVIFMSDNGPTRGRYNADLRGAKANVYEGGIRVPFYVRWPDRLEAGKRIDRIAAHIDLFPTLLEIAGIDVPPDRVIDGKSLAPLWTGRQSSSEWPDRTLFTQHIKSIVQAPYQNATAITQRYKLVSYPKTANASHFSADTANLELELYDLESDPSESMNLSKTNREILRRLQSEYEAWYRAMQEERGFQPGTIHVGTEHENPSLLCRYQDGHRPYGTDSEPLGWPILIENEGRFRIAKTDSQFLGAVMGIRWLGEERRIRMASTQSSVEIGLKSGEGMLDIWTEDLSGKVISKAFDVEIERL